MDKTSLKKSKSPSPQSNCRSDESCVPGTGEACTKATDCCPMGKYGRNCEYTAKLCDPKCANGYCDPRIGVCMCPTDGQGLQTYWGPQCETPVCPSLCLGQGDCDAQTGKCTCHRGFSGDDCGTVDNNLSCLKDSNGVVCSGNGVCTSTGECSCQPGYSGQICDTKKAEPACAGGGCGVGTCASDGTCICPINAGGSNCGSTMVHKPSSTTWLTVFWRLFLVLLAVAIAIMLFLLFTGRLDKYSKRSHG